MQAEWGKSADVIARSRLFADEKLLSIIMTDLIFLSHKVCGFLEPIPEIRNVAIWWRLENKKGKSVFFSVTLNGNQNSKKSRNSTFSLIHHQTNLELVVRRSGGKTSRLQYGC